MIFLRSYDFCCYCATCCDDWQATLLIWEDCKHDYYDTPKGLILEKGLNVPSAIPQHKVGNTYKVDSIPALFTRGRVNRLGLVLLAGRSVKLKTPQATGIDCPS